MQRGPEVDGDGEGSPSRSRGGPSALLITMMCEFSAQLGKTPRIALGALRKIGRSRGGEGGGRKNGCRSKTLRKVAVTLSSVVKTEVSSRGCLPFPRDISTARRELPNVARSLRNIENGGIINFTGKFNSVVGMSKIAIIFHPVASSMGSIFPP